MRRLAPVILVAAWILFLVLPIAFSLGAPAALLDREGFPGVYAALNQLIGDWPSRWLLSGLWLALNVALFWRVILGRKRYDPGPPVDLDD